MVVTRITVKPPESLTFDRAFGLGKRIYNGPELCHLYGARYKLASSICDDADKNPEKRALKLFSDALNNNDQFRLVQIKEYSKKKRVVSYNGIYITEEKLPTP